VLSNSWGGGDFSQALLDAINAANQADMLFVAAAGNSGMNNDLFAHYPSSYAADNVIGVAATNTVDERAWFSTTARPQWISVRQARTFSTTIGNVPFERHLRPLPTCRVRPPVLSRCALDDGAHEALGSVDAARRSPAEPRLAVA
jgi:subtilisin family serine protease